MPAKVSTFDIPDARRLGGRIRSDPDAADLGRSAPLYLRPSAFSRQHDGAGARKGQYTDRPDVHGTARQLGGPDTGQPSPRYLWINRAIKPSVSTTTTTVVGAAAVRLAAPASVEGAGQAAASPAAPARANGRDPRAPRQLGREAPWPLRAAPHPEPRGLPDAPRQPVNPPVRPPLWRERS